jgi:hypothetical protein
MLLRRRMDWHWHPLPLGAVVATAVLVDCVRTEDTATTTLEWALGDWTPGRWAWLLDDVQPVDPPMPAKGKQGWWDWTPEEARRLLQAEHEIPPSVDFVRRLIQQHRYRWASELDLQAGIHQALTEAGVDVRREVRLSARDRIDLLTSTGVGIEVKAHRPAEPPQRVMAQLARYSEHDELKALILVSTSTRHRFIQRTPSGMPVRFVLVGGLA